MRLMRLTGTTAAALLLSAGPALAVDFGSGDGTASMNVTGWGEDAFSAAGNLRAFRSGVAVYASGKLVYDFTSDNVCGRFTNNVTSTVNTYRDGTCVSVQVGTNDGAQMRLCRDVFGTDPCGSWTGTIRRN